MAEPVLRKGSTHPAVRDLQQAMKALGHDPGPIDGVFGNATESAVKAFQQEREIPVDGIVGKVTWINADDVPHLIASADQRFRPSSALDTNDSYTLTLDQPGTYPYFCTIHPRMTGRIIVE